MPVAGVLARARRPAGAGLRAAAARASAEEGVDTRTRRVLLLDPCPRGVSERLAGLGCDVQQRGPEELVVEALRRVRPEIIIVRSSLLKEKELEAADIDDLALVMRAGAGVDNIAVKALRGQGVIVSNAAGANAIAVAELTMAHLLNLDRKLCDQASALRAGAWRRLEFAEGAQGLYGRTLAVLGVGHIGKEVVKRARAFGMEVRAWSRSLSQEAAAELGAEWCAEPLAAVDGAFALAVHLPLNEDTRGLVGDEVFRKMQPGGLVVNMSRSGVVDEAALLRAVGERGLRAGLDVFANEPPAASQVFEDDAIRSCEHVYGTHHTGARTVQAAQAVEDAVVRAVEAFVRGGVVPGAVA